MPTLKTMSFFLILLSWTLSGSTQASTGWEAQVRRVSRTLAAKHALPMPDFQYLVEAVVEVESGGNPAAISGRGAMGLMQLTPVAVIESTRFCKLQPLGTGEAAMASILQPATNIWHGACYLAFLIRTALPNAGYSIGNQVAAPEVLLWYNGGLRQVARWHKGQRVALESRKYMLDVLQRIQAKQLIERWELTNGKGNQRTQGVPKRPRAATGRQSRSSIGDKPIQGSYLRVPEVSQPGSGAINTVYNYGGQ